MTPNQPSAEAMEHSPEMEKILSVITESINKASVSGDNPFTLSISVDDIKSAIDAHTASAVKAALKAYIAQAELDGEEIARLRAELEAKDAQIERMYKALERGEKWTRT
jgi:5-bromo-4-chloroindolyl phosphate hydrolysis protein